MLRFTAGRLSLDREPFVVILASIVGISSIIFGTLPILMGLYSEQVQLSWPQMGWLGATAQAGTLGGTLIAYRVIAGGALRAGLLRAASCATLFSLLTSTANGFFWLAAWQGLTGLAVGCVFAIGVCLLGRTRRPESAFSMMSGVQVACSSAYAALLPMLRMYAGLAFAVASVGFWFALIVLLAWRLPPAGSAPTARVISPRPAVLSKSSKFGVACALLSVMTFEIAVAAIWVFSERIGVLSGLRPTQIGAAIGIGGLGGLPASGLGTLVGNRLNPMQMLLLATLAVVAGEFLVLQSGAFACFLVGQLVFNFGWILGISYYMGLIAEHDRHGTIIRYIPPALILAAGIGPAFVGSLAKDSSIMTVGISCSSAGAALLFAVLMTKLLSPVRERSAS
jgi:predicted MFS family arabinose efflux permease